LAVVLMAATFSFAQAQDFYVTPLPTPLVRIPLRVSGASSAMAESGHPRMLKLLVGKDGFVHATAWLSGDAPTDSARILERAERWIFRPSRDEATNAPASVWVALPLRPEPDARLITRPDSALIAALSQADTLSAFRNGIGDLTHPDPPLLATTGFPGSVARRIGVALLQCLRQEAAYDGPGPWESRCLPDPDVVLELDGAGGRARVEISTACDWMQVRTTGDQLFAGYRPIRGQVLGVLTQVFPGKFH